LFGQVTPILIRKRTFWIGSTAGNVLNPLTSLLLSLRGAGKESSVAAFLITKFPLDSWKALNNKIRVIRRRAYGIKDQECLMLKIVNSFIIEQKES
jgi:hypothetical protein